MALPRPTAPGIPPPNVGASTFSTHPQSATQPIGKGTPSTLTGEPALGNKSAQREYLTPSPEEHVLALEKAFAWVSTDT